MEPYNMCPSLSDSNSACCFKAHLSCHKTDLLNVIQSFNLGPCSQYIYIGLLSLLFKKSQK